MPLPTALAHPAAPSARRAPASRATMVEGEVAPILLRLTLPTAAAVLAMIGYGVVETWMVGRLGPQALSAVSFTFPVTMVVISLGIGLGAGTSAVVARALGAGEADVPGLVADALLLTAGVAAAAAAGGVALIGPLFRALGAPDALMPEIAGYLHLWFPAAVLFLCSVVGLSVARASGDAAFQGLATAAMVGISLLAAPPLIFGLGPLPGVGLRGAALANMTGWSFLLAATLWRLRRLGLLSPARPAFARFAASARRVLRVGLPAAATNTVIPVSAGIITALLAGFGPEAVAGFGVATRIESLALVAFYALSAVMNPFTGQNAGADRLDRVRAALGVTYGFCLAYGAVLAVVLYFAAPAIAGLFTADPAVAATTAAYLTLVPVSFGAAGVIAVVNAAFNGLNRPGAALAVSVLRTLVVNVPVAWLGGQLFGATGVFGGICVANFAVGLLAAVWAWRATGVPPAAAPAAAPAPA